MDGTFWFGIAIGAALSLIASIVANLMNGKIQKALDSGRGHISNRRLRILSSNYTLINKLKSGEKDKYIYFIVGSAIAIICLQISFFAMGFSIYLGNKYSPKILDSVIGLSLDDIWWGGPAIVMFIAGVSLALLSIMLIDKLKDVSKNLDNFERYDEDMRQSYPQIFKDRDAS